MSGWVYLIMPCGHIHGVGALLLHVLLDWHAHGTDTAYAALVVLQQFSGSHTPAMHHTLIQYTEFKTHWVPFNTPT